MALYNYPVGYQQTYPQQYQPQPMYQPMYQGYQGSYQASYQPQTQTPAQPVQQQIQNGGFIPVQSIDEARNWPVAPGNSITFKDENAPRVYTKTMGFSQLDRPIFEVYKLVKEVEPMDVVPIDIPQESSTAQHVEYITKEDLADIRKDLDELKRRISGKLDAQIIVPEERAEYNERPIR